jgi:cobalt-zinc-cadmium efflux system membrane fusion protein
VKRFVAINAVIFNPREQIELRTGAFMDDKTTATFSKTTAALNKTTATLSKTTVTLRVTAAIAVLSFVAGVYSVGHISGWLRSGLDAASSDANAQATDATTVKIGAQSVELNDKQMASVKVEQVREYLFPVERSTVGSIDFNEDMTVQVFTPYQGRIIETFAKVGDEVKKGQTLFTIDSPDLLAASSNLISTAGVLNLTTRALNRLKSLYESRAVAQKDLEQGVSDQQTAEGAYKAARDAVRIFGKSEDEIDMIVK